MITYADYLEAKEQGKSFNQFVTGCFHLRDADLYGADLSDADLSYANLSNADLSNANLYGANLHRADLSGARGLLSAIDFLQENFEYESDGSLIAYKTFGQFNRPPDGWIIKEGSIISEVCNPCRVSDCASGINVAKRDWSDFARSYDLWKVRIRPQWLATVVVPYNTDGKIRCERIELIEIVNKDTD